MALFVVCCAIAAMIAVALLLWLRRPVESAPAQPKTIVLGSAGRAVPAIPRRLWSYWHSDDVPLVVARCLENWRHHCPGWDIQLIVGNALHRHVEPGALPDDFDRLPPVRRSDWLRLHLLARHGGVWIDASTILTTSLDWMREAQQRSGAHYLGYYLEGFGVEGRPPVVESWAMAAPAGSPFVLAWAGELDRALAVGDAAYLDALQQEGRYS